ncbi:hypothetical protein GJ496_006414 [Pomphorhynchus laevis]|nr:hypothetical protein GJ496_006414 [Pomphorhynchus laevis]
MVGTIRHVPIMCAEIFNILKGVNVPKKRILDLTYGGGGHSRHILKNDPLVNIVALDRDPKAFRQCQNDSEMYQGRLIAKLGRHSEITSIFNNNTFHGAIIDCGISSIQLSDLSRGFSFECDNSLDMRINESENILNAADVINKLDEKSLTELIRFYGEDHFAEQISNKICYRRKYAQIQNVKELADIVTSAVYSTKSVEARRDKLNRRVHPATQTLLALRIFVNDELNELQSGILASNSLLANNCPLIVITFNSHEDRIVKQCFRNRQLWTFNEHRNKMTPNKEEIDNNPRSRSSRLRWAYKK